MHRRKRRERGREWQDGSRLQMFKLTCCGFQTQSHKMLSVSHLSIDPCLHCPALDSNIFLFQCEGVTCVCVCVCVCVTLACTAVQGWGGEACTKCMMCGPLRVEPERPLNKGTEWVVGRSTESVTGLLGCCSFD